MRHLPIIILLMLAVRPFHAECQRVMFWNCENLFDVQDDSLHQDEEFLPESERRWTPHRYWTKLDNIARTIAAVAEDSGWPMLVGLAEVENDSVMIALTRRSPLWMAHYEYVMTDSPDLRGVDVALLYHPDMFELVRSWSVRIPSQEHGCRPTRDILCSEGVLPQGDTICALVVHFPSRAGDSKKSDDNRMLAARTLRQVVDSLAGKRVIVMGDFNATPRDLIFRELLPPLTSLMPQKKRELRKAQGTYVYQGMWDYLDHFLVSSEMMPFVERRAHVARFPFLLNEKGHPNRTYRGPIYQGGISDHLPIWVDISHP